MSLHVICFQFHLGQTNRMQQMRSIKECFCAAYSDNIILSLGSQILTHSIVTENIQELSH